MNFSYRAGVAPMMWAFVSVALVEAAVVHLLVMLWHPWLAVALSVASLVAVVSIVRLIRSFDRLPVVITDDTLTMRSGTLRGVATPLANVRRCRDGWSAQTLKERDVLKLSLLAYPNVVVDLCEPVVVGRRTVSAVAHRLERPDVFRTELARRMGH